MTVGEFPCIAQLGSLLAGTATARRLRKSGARAQRGAGVEPGHWRAPGRRPNLWGQALLWAECLPWRNSMGGAGKGKACGFPPSFQAGLGHSPRGLTFPGSLTLPESVSCSVTWNRP